ncbi:MAG TPA: hypothetical protein VJ462_02280 [Thermodesulfobacteriota bacterium]|jgi:hypothetical protein|nr:hypothetical protein [Thermodesulfobacteriota bacterium]
MNHPGRRKEGGEELIQNANRLSWPFEVGVTEPHPEFSLIEERALGMIGNNLFEPPQSFFYFTLREKEFSIPEKKGVLRLRLGGKWLWTKDQDQEKEDESPSPISWSDRQA